MTIVIHDYFNDLKKIILLLTLLGNLLETKLFLNYAIQHIKWHFPFEICTATIGDPGLFNILSVTFTYLKHCNLNIFIQKHKSKLYHENVGADKTKSQFNRNLLRDGMNSSNEIVKASALVHLFVIYFDWAATRYKVELHH